MALQNLQQTMRSLFRGLPARDSDIDSDQQIQILSEITRAVASTMDGADSAHRLITEAITSLLRSERSILFLPDPTGGFRAAAASGLVDQQKIGGLKIPGDIGAVARVFDSGKTIFIPDANNPPFPLSDMANELGVQSIAAAPLRLQQETIGVIVADTRRDGRPFTPADIRMLEVFGTLAAFVASEARLIDELRRRNAEMESLFDVARHSNSEASPEAVLRMILDNAVEHTGSSSGSIMFVDPNNQELVIRASEGLPDDVGEHMRLSVGQGVTGWVASQGLSARIDDVRSDDRYVEASGTVRSELAVPIKTGNEIVGVLNVDSDHVDAYTDEHQQYLEALADLAASRIRLAFSDQGDDQS